MASDPTENSDQGHVCLTLLNEPASMSRITAALEELKERMGLSQKDVFTARLCAEEVLTNILVHGYSDADEHEIDFELSADRKQIRLEFRDDGIPFDPRETATMQTSDDILETSTGGRGVALVQLYANTIDYRYDNDRNCLSFTLNRDPVSD